MSTRPSLTAATIPSHHCDTGFRGALLAAAAAGGACAGAGAGVVVVNIVVVVVVVVVIVVVVVVDFISTISLSVLPNLCLTLCAKRLLHKFHLKAV